MSRTYRRRRYRQMSGSGDPLVDFWAYEEDIVWEDISQAKNDATYGFYFGPRYTVSYKANSKTGRKLVARARSDAATHSCKEPGPSWFRNLYSDRPLRRKAKNEIHKFMLDPEYEPMIYSMGKLPYWT